MRAIGTALCAWLLLVTMAACGGNPRAPLRATSPAVATPSAGHARTPSQRPQSATATLGPADPPRVAFATSTQGAIVAPIIERADGSLAVTSEDGALYLLDAGGAILHRIDTGAPLRAGAVDLGRDRLWVINTAGRAWCIDAAGQISAQRTVSSSPVLHTLRLGDLWLAVSDGLYALDGEGQTRWHHVEPELLYTAPCIGNDLVVYGTLDGRVLALDAAGTVRWRSRASAHVIQLRCRAAGVEALDALGSLTELDWQGQTRAVQPPPDAGVRAAAPPQTRDAQRSYAMDGTDVTAAGDDDRILWRYNLGARVLADPLVTRRGLLILGADDGTVYALE